MNIDIVRDGLLWCTIINYGLLLWWFAFFVLGKDFLRRFHGRWFDLTDQQFDVIHYGGMGLYKLGIFLFNLVPYVALRIVE